MEIKNYRNFSLNKFHCLRDTSRGVCVSEFKWVEEVTKSRTPFQLCLYTNTTNCNYFTSPRARSQNRDSPLKGYNFFLAVFKFVSIRFSSSGWDFFIWRVAMAESQRRTSKFDTGTALSLIPAPLGKFINKPNPNSALSLDFCRSVNLSSRTANRFEFSSFFCCFRRIFGGQDIDEEFRTWKAIKTSLIYKTLLRWRFMCLLNIFGPDKRRRQKTETSRSLCDYQLVASPQFVSLGRCGIFVSRHFRVSIAVSLLHRINRAVLGSAGTANESATMPACSTFSVERVKAVSPVAIASKWLYDSLNRFLIKNRLHSHSRM